MTSRKWSVPCRYSRNAAGQSSRRYFNRVEFDAFRKE
nr:MAG TPA: hypothetical protein [Caudoviricetes sp.]